MSTDTFHTFVRVNFASAIPHVDGEQPCDSISVPVEFSRVAVEGSQLWQGRVKLLGVTVASREIEEAAQKAHAAIVAHFERLLRLQKRGERVPRLVTPGTVDTFANEQSAGYSSAEALKWAHLETQHLKKKA